MSAIDNLIQKNKLARSKPLSATPVRLSNIDNLMSKSTPATAPAGTGFDPLTPFLPRQEPVEVRRAFEKEPIKTKLPPIVTGLADLGNLTVEAIPKALTTVAGETGIKIPFDTRRVGFEEPQYKKAEQLQKEAIDRGENPWISGLKIASEKTLDVAFGAQILSSLAKSATAKLLKGGVEARIEAQNVVDAFKKESKDAFDRLKNAPLAERERTLADLANAKNEAEKILREQGSPTNIDILKAKTARTTEVAGRETPITDALKPKVSEIKSYPARFAQPDITPRTAPLPPVRIAGALPGYREVPTQAPAFGLSTRKVEPIGGVEEKKVALQIAKEALDNHPAKVLVKYANKKTGELPEVLGTGKGIFKTQGDNIVTEVGGFPDSETARASYQDYLKLKDRVNALEQEINIPKQPLKLSAEGIPLALNARERAIVAGRKVAPIPKVPGSEGEVRSIEIQAEEALARSKQEGNVDGLSLENIVKKSQTDVKDKINALDFFRTPNRVLTKIGLGDESKLVREQYDKYLYELPKNIEKITEWSKRVPAQSNVRIFRYLDGKAIDLTPDEKKVALEIRSWLEEWANRLGLPKDNRITYYITHIFDADLIKKEFDEDLAKIIANKLPGEIYDPFLKKRLGELGYLEDTWQALDAYVKRATRKVYMDPALEKIKEKAGGLEKSQSDYVQKYVNGLNMRPTQIDDWFDNGIKTMIGYKLGVRPTSAILTTLRRVAYRAMLGLNPGSALRNLSQGVNTYATLGEKYTTIGYAKLFNPHLYDEVVESGIFSKGFIEDRALSATKKTMQRIDKALFIFFDTAEHTNRAAAYFGAKTKALDAGKTEEEAIKYAKEIVAKTQFMFDKVDAPILMQSDIGKTAFQFQSYTTKQIEFLTEMAKNKNFAGLVRYALAGSAFIYFIGQAFGMKPKELLPLYRFGVPPSLKVPAAIGSAALNLPNKYGQERDIKEKLSDIGKSFTGVIPAGTQAKKSYEGYKAIQEGKSTTKTGVAQFDVGGTPAKDVQALLFGKYAGKSAQDYFENDTTYAEATLKKLQKSPTKKEDFDKIIKENPALARGVLKVIEKQKLGITDKDEKLLNLGVANKMRATEVARQLNKLKTKEDKAKLWDEYVKKKIITKDVAPQLNELLKKEESFSESKNKDVYKEYEKMIIQPKKNNDVFYLQKSPKSTVISYLKNIKDKIPFFESRVGKRMKEDALSSYAFDENIKNLIREQSFIKDTRPMFDKVLGISKEDGKVKIGSPSPLFGGASSEGRIADYVPFGRDIINLDLSDNSLSGLGKILAKPAGPNRINIKVPTPEIIAHELIHAVIDERGSKRPPEEFNKTWDNLAKSDKRLQVINNLIKDSGLYEGMDEWNIANERIAYLGGMLGVGGLQAFPKELQQDYVGIFK